MWSTAEMLRAWCGAWIERDENALLLVAVAAIVALFVLSFTKGCTDVAPASSPAGLAAETPLADPARPLPADVGGVAQGAAAPGGADRVSRPRVAVADRWAARQRRLDQRRAGAPVGLSGTVTFQVLPFRQGRRRG